MDSTLSTPITSIAVDFSHLSNAARRHEPRFSQNTDRAQLAVHNIESRERSRSTIVDGKALIWVKVIECGVMGDDTQALDEVYALFRRLADDIDFATDLLCAEEPRVDDIDTLELGPREFLAWVKWHGESINEDRIAALRDAESRERFIRMTSPLL